jgi:hypothetical protein
MLSPRSRVIKSGLKATYFRNGLIWPHSGRATENGENIINTSPPSQLSNNWCTQFHMLNLMDVNPN